MKDLMFMLFIIVVWFVLNRYILPKAGIQT